MKLKDNYWNSDHSGGNLVIIIMDGGVQIDVGGMKREFNI